MPAKEPELFKTKVVKAKEGSGKLFEDVFEKNEGPITCLGMTFDNDDARRDYFTELLREKLKDPEFRKIEGFPIGEDEDILALSDPPYYTACPNPWLNDFIEEWETQKPEKPEDYHYHREPFATDVREGKTHAIYKAHSYHTKVPHLAIVPSILHYTQPGDIVLDGFCGSGMSGIAAQWCESPPEEYKRLLEQKWKDEGKTSPNWGIRKCILNDLSPAATFISSNYNIPFSIEQFSNAVIKLLYNFKKAIGWMYETIHTDGKTKGEIEYTVWSEVFTCPECTGEIIFSDEAIDKNTNKVRKEFPCPHCAVKLNKRNLDKKFETTADKKLSDVWRHLVFRPVLISYKIGKKRFEKVPDEHDVAKIKEIGKLPFPEEIPDHRFPIENMYHGSRIAPKGYTHTHHFYLPRTAQVLGTLWGKAKGYPDPRIRHMLMFILDSHLTNLSIENRYRPDVSFPYNPLTGVYYIPSLISEASPFTAYKNKLERLVQAFQNQYFHQNCIGISTGSTVSLPIKDDSIDYIFTDPPFGENIFYADLNLKVEPWYRVLSNTKTEAIVDKTKKKNLVEYQELMKFCFGEYYRILKSGRWITIVFHNSRNAVWNAIQEALQRVGFVVADVRTLDKEQGSFRQVTSTATKQDLVISAYKPNGGLEERFELAAGTENGVWDFIRTHLGNLPVFVNKNGKSEIIAERKEFILYDRMVAFHVQRAVTVPYSANEFYQGLALQFSERDGMYFLPNQVAEYDKNRMTVKEVEQLKLFVSDESSARHWLRELLKDKPQTFQELHPKFIKELGGWSKTEKLLELSTLLEQNFLCYDGKGPVPSQIHAHLSTDYKKLRNREKDDPQLISKAKDRWYVPDPNKAEDLERIREKSLLKEFEIYRQEAKKIKILRLEAVRAGFKKAWQEKDYTTIKNVAQKIPAKILEEDPILLRWYDHAITRTEG